MAIAPSILRQLVPTAYLLLVIIQKTCSDDTLSQIFACSEANSDVESSAAVPACQKSCQLYRPAASDVTGSCIRLRPPSPTPKAQAFCWCYSTDLTDSWNVKIVKTRQPGNTFAVPPFLDVVKCSTVNCYDWCERQGFRFLDCYVEKADVSAGDEVLTCECALTNENQPTSAHVADPPNQYGFTPSTSQRGHLHGIAYAGWLNY